TKFLFAEDTPEELVSIFNKCIASFNESDVNAMMMTATIEQIEAEPQTIRELMISALAMVLGTFAIWLFLHLIKARRRLIYTAFYDELTGLPNLTKFKIEAKKILEENPTRAHGVLLTDIADFSLINEKYGFDVGDLIIKSVGTSLTQLKSFTTLTARISSNMFISLYVYDEVEEESISANESLHTYKYQDTFINFFHYFGRYLIPVGETDVNDIYEKASYAHLFAKKNGIKERIVDYDHEAKKNSVRNQEIEEKMYNSLEKKDFKVYLQPKYKCDGKTLVGAEALVRWFDSTTNQMIFPNDFIPLFEHNGFVIYLDFYMFEEVCKLLSQWKKSGLELITISVNFSRLHFNNTSKADTLFEITKKYDVDTKYLEIEITENALSTEVSEISEMIVKLSSYGFKISLDDFSSQNSSLLFLAEVPVNVVKLDKAFVSAISDGNANYLLVDGTIQILKKLKFVVVAEGVETNEQVQLLDKMNCDIIQGYIFSKPIPANDVEKLLSTSKA
ncbi:MAG: EAL domain-containing protein, partial [Anaerotignaceae bacterium]